MELNNSLEYAKGWYDKISSIVTPVTVGEMERRIKNLKRRIKYYEHKEVKHD